MEGTVNREEVVRKRRQADLNPGVLQPASQDPSHAAVGFELGKDSLHRLATGFVQGFGLRGRHAGAAGLHQLLVFAPSDASSPLRALRAILLADVPRAHHLSGLRALGNAELVLDFAILHAPPNAERPVLLPTLSFIPTSWTVSKRLGKRKGDLHDMRTSETRYFGLPSRGVPARRRGHRSDTARL